MNPLLANALRGRKKLLLAILVSLVASMVMATVVFPGRTLPPPPEGCYYNLYGWDEGIPPIVCLVDDSCDYGRNPEMLWPDNPDGHPFERAFCDGNTEVKYKHPLDSPENEALYCDEVPGCWAYGLTQPGHH